MGSCETLTKEAVNNAIRNKGLIFQKNNNLTQEEIFAQLEQIHNLHDKKDEKYYIFGIPIKRRVSEYAKRLLGLRASSESHDQEVGRQAGTYIHSIMERLINFHYNKQGNFHAIKQESMSGEFKIKEVDFNELDKLAHELIAQIEEQQKKIDPSKKAIIRPEFFVLNPKTNIGGTIDLFALFSDGTASIYDYKTRRPYDKDDANVATSSGLTLQSDLFTPSNSKSYDLAMQTYHEILTNAYNVKSVQQNRLVPILVAFRYLNDKTYDKDAKRTIDKELVAIRAGESSSEYLAQLPIKTEASRFEGLNKLLTKQLSELDRLIKLQNTKGISKEERKTITDRISSIQKAVRNIRLREDMSSTIDDLALLLHEIRTVLNQKEKNENGSANQLYPDLRKLSELQQHLAVYKNILDEAHSFFADLKKTNPEEFKNQYTRLRALSGLILDHSDELSRRVESEVLKNISEVHKKSNGSLKDLPELNWIESRTLHFSDMDHPIFKEGWKIIQEQLYKTKKEFKDLDDRAWKVTDALFKWAKQNGMSNQAAFDLLIDKKTGNLTSVLNREFSSKVYKLLETTPDQNINEVYKQIREYFDFKDKQEWKKRYEKRKLEWEASLKAQYNNFEDIVDESGTILKTAKQLKESYDKAMTKFVSENDLENSKAAWLNKYNRGYIEIRPELQKANYSEQYKKILSNKPLLDYYNMWIDSMERFNDVLNIRDYEYIPKNFIPNIRKEMIEHFSKSGLNPKAAIGEFLDSFSVREEDTYLSQVDEEGNVRKEIPISFLNPFRDKDGNVDLERKSYDLTSSLLLFGKMAYNYKNMYEIEPKIQALKALLANPTSEQGATEVTDRLGKRIRGYVRPYLTKAGLDTETYKVFEAFTDRYLYGTKFTEKSLSDKIDTTKLLLKIKNYNAITKLGFAAIPALGAYVAGKSGIYFEAKKKISYTEKDWKESQILLMTKPKTYLSLAEYFDPYNDDAYERIFRGRSATAKRKLFSDRAAFWPLRKADEKIMNHITIAMAHNYGLDKDGNLVRLNKPGVDASLYTPIIEAFKIKENGQIELNMKEEAFIAFRRAIKKTSSGIIGNMDPEDVSMTDLSLTQNIMMQFKTWMPAVVREYTGKLRYDEDIQAVRWGRFKALGDQFGMQHLTTEDLDTTTKIALFTKKVLVPQISKLILDLATFGMLEKYHTFGFQRINEERLKLKYKLWLDENPEMINKVSYEEFLEVKKGQLRATMAVMRTIIGSLALIMMLKFPDDDEEPMYMKNWATRTAYKVLTKAESELAFVWTPNEFIKMLENPAPMLQLLGLAGKTLKNGNDEFLDFIYGENSPQDKSPAGYYMTQWAPGGSQISRFLELFEGYKKSPYAQVTFR